MNFMIVSGMLVCSSFLISVCKYIVSKSLFISNATVIVRAGGGYLVEPRCYGVVKYVFCTRVAWMCLVFLLLCKEAMLFSGVCNY